MLIAALFLELNCVVHNCWFIKRNNEFGWFGFFLLTWLGRALIVFQVQVILVFRRKVELKMHWLLAHLCNQRRGELSLSLSLSAFIFTAKVSMNNNALLIYLISLLSSWIYFLWYFDHWISMHFLTSKCGDVWNHVLFVIPALLALACSHFMSRG